MKMEFDVYESSELLQCALKIKKVEPSWPLECGEYCPRCRLAEAKTKLDDKYNLPCELMDGMLGHFAWKLPRCSQHVDKAESDRLLEKLLTEDQTNA
jgi:hypothetical protein